MRARAIAPISPTCRARRRHAAGFALVPATLVRWAESWSAGSRGTTSFPNSTRCPASHHRQARRGCLHPTDLDALLNSRCITRRIVRGVTTDPCMLRAA